MAFHTLVIHISQGIADWPLQELQTYIAVEEITEECVSGSTPEEVWGQYPDDQPLEGYPKEHPLRAEQPGDTRAALTPMLAHEVNHVYMDCRLP